MMNVFLPFVHVPRDTKGAFTKDYEARPGDAHLAFQTEGRQEGESGHAETPHLKTQQTGKDYRRACSVT